MCRRKSQDWKCPFCLQIFTAKSQLTQHMVVKHGAARNDISCEICGKQFISDRIYRVHKRTVHEGNYGFTCPICQKGFMGEGDLDGHLNKHKGIKPYACEACSSTFSHRKNLLSHIRCTHEGIHNFICAICQKSFRRKSEFDKHMIKHE